MYSILYPVIAESPSLSGADQKRLICVEETAVAVRPVGGSGILVAFASLCTNTKMRIEESNSNRKCFTVDIIRKNRLIKT